MRIGVVGTGYVGLVSGTCFAEFGLDVCCLDKDQGKIDRLKAGEIPIYEPGLEDLVAKQVKQGRLSFTCDLNEAVQNSVMASGFLQVVPRRSSRCSTQATCAMHSPPSPAMTATIGQRRPPTIPAVASA